MEQTFWMEELLASGQATGQDLQEIAQTRPDLWPAVLAQPAMYPELEEWIRVQWAQLEPPAPVEVSVAAAPPKKRKGLIWAAVAALVALAAGGVGLWFFGPWGDSSKDVLAVVPDTAYTAVVAGLGDTEQLVPIGDQGQEYLVYKDQILIGVDGDAGPQVLAISTDSEDVGPVWVQGLEEPGVCSLAGDILSCGSSAYSLEGGTPEPAAEPDTSDPAAELDPSESTPPPSSELPFPAAAKLRSSPTPGTQYALAGHDLVDSSGDVVVESFALGGRAWALEDPDGVTVVSDGQEVIGLRYDQVEWELELPQGSLAINLLPDGTMTWVRTDNTLVLGSPGALTAYDVATGSALWQVQVPLSSYTVTPGMILVTMDDAVALLPLPSKGETSDGQLVKAGEDGEDDEDESGDESSPAAPLAEPALYEGFDGDLLVSADCMSRVANQDSPQVLSFTSGQATGLGPTGAASVSIEAVYQTVNDGVPYALAWLRCDEPSSSASTEVAVYDSDLDLVQSVPGYRGVTASVSRSTEILDVAVGDETLAISSGPWMGWGDTWCMSCDGDYTATVLWKWTGGLYVLSETLYDSPAGVVAAPDLDTLNNIYDAVANGSRSSVSKFFTGEANTVLDMGDMCLGETCKNTLGAVLFAPGGEVAACTLMPAEGQTPYFSDLDVRLDAMYIPGFDIAPGDFVCAVSSGHSMFANSEPNHIWWMVRPTSDPKDFRVYDIGRDFG